MEMRSSRHVKRGKPVTLGKTEGESALEEGWEEAEIEFSNFDRVQSIVETVERD